MGSRVKNIEYFLPSKVLTNNELAEEFHRWESEKIEEKLGIKERHIAEENQTASDLGFCAAEKLLANYPRENIDALIFCTQSPDYFLPATSCVLQEKLKLKKNCAVFDINQGCSGFIYGLAIAKSFITSNIAQNILLITAETYSKHINPKDLANKTIFGDGAAAILIEKSELENIFEFVLGSDGSGYNNLIVKAGGFRHPYNKDPEIKMTNSGDIYTDNNLYMNGREIFNFTIEAVPLVVKECLMKNNLTIDEVDYFIFHQANKFMIDYLRQKIGIPENRFYNNIELTGNTVSSTIPIALKDAKDNSIIKPGDKILICGFGVGYSWGATIITI